MKLTAVEIRKQEFSKTLRGYNPHEVTAFLEIVAAEFEQLQLTNKELSEKITETETALQTYKSIEKAIQQTFMQAQETSGKSIENARKEAQLLLHEAEMKASQILDKARSELTVLKEHMTILKAKKDSIVSRLKMLLNSEMELIKALEIDEELQASSGSEHKTMVGEKSEIEDIIRGLE